MRPAFVLMLGASIALGAAACSCGGRDHDGSADGDADTEADSTEEDSDAADTNQEEPDEPDGWDCLDSADFVADTAGWDVESFFPSRPGRDCGPGCRQVSFAEHDVWIPNYEVWGRYLALNTASGSSPVIKQVIVVDLYTLEHHIIRETISAPEPEYTAWVEIFGDTLMYIYEREYTQKYLYTFSLATGESEILLDRTLDSVLFPSGYIQMECPLVAYEYNVGTGRTQVVLMDLATLERRIMPTMSGYGLEPKVSGSRVAFQDNYGGRTHVGVYDIDEDRVIWYLEGAWDKYSPDINGDIVVWTDTREGGEIGDPTNGDIYMVDLSTGDVSPVCDHPAAQSGGSSVWGEWVAWHDYRNDPTHPNEPIMATEIDIYARNIVTDEERQITAMPGREDLPKVFEGRVYFIAIDDSGIESVFEADLE